MNEECFLSRGTILKVYKAMCSQETMNITNVFVATRRFIHSSIHPDIHKFRQQVAVA
jgi:hypothetical protein